MITHSHSDANRLAAADRQAGLLVDPDWIAEHLHNPDVRLVEVTPGNRDGLPAELEAWLRERIADRPGEGSG